jgi:UDP-glucose 4-epimerase
VTVVVTGAGGFIGRLVVASLVARGETVRALVRPGRTRPAAWSGGVEVVERDLLRDDVADALEGVDAVVHLAAKVLGSDEGRFASAVVGTERLLDAMKRSPVRRLVLASSLAVYDWSCAGARLDERSPTIEEGLYDRDGYTVAKVWQERVVRRASAAQGFELTTLRPGFVWGPGGEWVPGSGQRIGPVYAVIAPAAHLPLTYVENCADCFALAATHPAAGGRSFNVVDDGSVTAWRYMGDYLRGAGGRGMRLPVPYPLAYALVQALNGAMQRLTRGRARLPSIAVPARFEARFKPLAHSAEEARRVLGWTPAVPVEEALRRTFGTAGR